MTHSRDRHGRAGVVAICAAACLATALTACSSTSSKPTAATSETAGASAKGTPIKLMVITTVGNPASSYPEAYSAAEAAASAVNAAGGVNGHPLDVQLCNDNFDPNDATQCGRSAVAAHVAAVVGDVSTYADNYMPILKAAGIPDVGNLDATSDEATFPNSFPLEVGTAVILQAQAAELVNHGKKKIAVVYINIPVVAPLLASITAKIPSLGSGGGKVVAQIPVPATATDMSSYSAELKASGANGALFVLGTAQLEQLLEADYQGGVTSQVTGGVQTLPPAALQQLGPAADGLQAIDSYLPATDTADAGIAQFNKELDSYGMKDPRTDTAVAAWASVHIVANLMTKAHTTTASGLTTALKAAGTINFPGVGAFNWSKPISQFLPERVFSTQLSYSVVQNGKIVVQGNSSTGFSNILNLPSN
jgi:branched-chain amino acid transport system substrate-binding protein